MPAKGVPLIIDASQSAGIVPLDMTALGAAFIAMPGHKGLYGPRAPVSCYAKRGRRPPRSWREAPAASPSSNPCRSFYRPPGSRDPQHARHRGTPGRGPIRPAAGAGVHLPEGAAPCSAGGGGLADHPRRPRLGNAGSDGPGRGGLLHRRWPGRGESGQCPWENRGVAVRAGLHCAPLAHRTAGTLESGTVRLSFSALNTPAEVCRFLTILRKLSRG